ncbi:MAG: Ger(x)C family spore germination protein, partial [Clostridiaceae bacterium]|nr:Ger(x)C family spore germination protein [Clostridiaceae bacterium]
MIKRQLRLCIKYLPILMIVVLTGCWDYTEVEDRGYVLGLSIDKAFPIPRGLDDLDEYLGERELEIMPLQEGDPKYAYTVQIPIIPEAVVKPEGAGGGGGAEERAWNLTIVGNNFFEVNRQLSTRLDFPPFYEHLKVIVISEEVAREGIMEPLDMFLRDHEMRRRTRLFITPHEAKKALDVSPRIEDYASIYLEKLPFNADKTSRIAHKTDLGEVSKSIHGGVDFVLPRIIAIEDEVKNAGVAIFKNNKMVGWLGEIDTIYAKWVRDAVLGGIIAVEGPEGIGQLVVEVTQAKTQVRPKVSNDDITMKIDIEAKFNFVEELLPKEINAFDREFIKDVERKVKEKLEREIKDTVEYVQEEY